MHSVVKSMISAPILVSLISVLATHATANRSIPMDVDLNCVDFDNKASRLTMRLLSTGSSQIGTASSPTKLIADINLYKRGNYRILVWTDSKPQLTGPTSINTEIVQKAKIVPGKGEENPFRFAEYSLNLTGATLQSQDSNLMVNVNALTGTITFKDQNGVPLEYEIQCFGKGKKSSLH